MGGTQAPSRREDRGRLAVRLPGRRHRRLRPGSEDGISSANTLSHGKGFAETHSAYASMSRNARLYASGAKADASFDLAQKLGAGDKYDPAKKKPQRLKPSPQQRQRFHLDPMSNSPSPIEFTLDY
jgi:hypothetical protein